MKGPGNLSEKLFLQLLRIPQLFILLVEQLGNYFLFSVEQRGPYGWHGGHGQPLADVIGTMETK